LVKEVASVLEHFPREIVPISFNLQKIEKNFANYPNNVMRDVVSFCVRQVMVSNVKSQGANNSKRMTTFFYGPPGTGKTRIVDLMAQSLGVPFAYMSLENATVEDIQGRGITTNNPYMGRFLEALINANKKAGTPSKNAILFIDEFDRVLNSNDKELVSFMLKLLDPEQKKIYCPYLGTEIDISNLIIVTAGNYLPQDDALLKRMQITYFPGFNLEVKREVIWDKTIPRFCENYSQNGKYIITVKDFTQEDRDYINELISMDADPGFRAVENILTRYMDYIALRKYFNRAAERPDLKAVLMGLNMIHEAGDFSKNKMSGQQQLLQYLAQS